MSDRSDRGDDLIRFFREREKELECLYNIEELLVDPEEPREKVLRRIIETVPSGWQFPNRCYARITIGSKSYSIPGFVETPWVMTADVFVEDAKKGEISVFYSEEMPPADEGPFLKQEKRLLKTIADRIGNFILQQRLREAAVDRPGEAAGEWRVILNLLHHTDRTLFETVSEKMLNLLCWSGVEEAERLRGTLVPVDIDFEAGLDQEANKPYKLHSLEITDRLSDEIFRIATGEYTNEQLLDYLRKWIQDDKLSYLLHVGNRNLPLSEVIGALRQYRDMSPSRDRSLPGGEERRDRLPHHAIPLEAAQPTSTSRKNISRSATFFEILDRIIYTPESHGQLGGKGAGLFLAQQIIKKSYGTDALFANVKVPKSWYITSDVLLGFLRFNNLDEVIEQKYKDINQVRLEYPHVMLTFKNSRFPPEVVQGLSMVLDELEGMPLIIRSSSLLEDSLGAAFSGKYKSLFLANQGTKQERLEALLDAVAEVYASIFGPDPIEYRAERGLLDFSEEMGIMIQGVVGSRVGDYFLPSFAGVAFSRNEFRWSPRIKREDGLIRTVPGLGTRAVDRVSDDYPALIAPGQPGLRVNVATEEIVYYTPKKIDVINLKTNTFETIDAKDLLRKHGAELPLVEKMVSIYDGHNLRKPMAMNIDFEHDDLPFTLDGLISDTPFVKQVHGILKLLEEKLGFPVDIEFAHDGTDFYLLQCRPQSFSPASAPAPIPQDIPAEKIVFSAKRYISNGRVPGHHPYRLCRSARVRRASRAG